MGETISTSAGVSMVWFTLIPAPLMPLLLPFISVRALDSHWNRLVKQLFHGKPVNKLSCASPVYVAPSRPNFQGHVRCKV